jgi:kynurenine formamidase
MGRNKPGDYGHRWSPPQYEVDDDGKVVGAVPPEPNNWGRWGAEDQRGTTNLITPELVAAAAGLITDGESHSLAIPIDAQAPVHFTRPKILKLHSIAGSDYVVGSPSNQVFEGMQWTDDIITMALQGSTQWDGLAHLLRDDYMYNGWWCGEVTAAGGAARNGIQHQRETLVGRGVLLDVCAFRGGDPMAGGEVILPAELDEVAAAQGVEVRAGDIVLVRTGYLGAWYELTDFVEKNDTWFTVEPGLSWRCAQWCRDRDVAGLGIDNWAIDVVPFEPDADRVFPFHQIAIPGLGLTMGEFWWLDDLSEVCARKQRYEFFLAAQPLNITNGSGTMLNPMAIF